MKLIVNNIYDLFSPSECEKRLYYRYKGEEETPPGPFEEMLFKLGTRHEKEHIDSLGKYENISRLPKQQQIIRTKELIESGAPIIYQGVLSANIQIKDSLVEVVGIPDIMILKGSSCVIRDCKIARHAEEKRHPEIPAQLQVYGYLYEKMTGKKPAKIEVFLGNREIVEIPYDNGLSAKRILKRLLDTVSLTDAPFSPVGWSKCQGCCYRELCWTEAKKNKDVAMVYDIDQNLARVLKEKEIQTIEDFLYNFDEKSLSELKRPRGNSLVRVGKKAKSIMLHAKAMTEGKYISLEAVNLPDNKSLVMFDIEGLPPFLDEFEKIYLWGLKVYGDNPSSFLPAVSPIEPDGDKKGWVQFLLNCQSIFDEYGDICFVHWHTYEKTKVNLYIKRYDDTDGVAHRVLNNLVDLLPLTKKAMVLPEPSYSLKVVEKLTNFKRTLNEYDGTVAMAKYIEAVETEDKSLRRDIMDQILKYNEEDLDATWAVFQWLKEQLSFIGYDRTCDGCDGVGLRNKI